MIPPCLSLRRAAAGFGPWTEKDGVPAQVIHSTIHIPARLVDLREFAAHGQLTLRGQALRQLAQRRAESGRGFEEDAGLLAEGDLLQPPRAPPTRAGREARMGRCAPSAECPPPDVRP